MKMVHPVPARTASVVEKKDAIGKLSEAPAPVDGARAGGPSKYGKTMGNHRKTIGRP